MKLHLLGLTAASALALALALSACAPKEEAAAPAAPAGAAYAALLASPQRPAADTARDADRKPAAVLAFARIMPGQTVLEVEAGGGYYTELLSNAVGPTGKVIMHSPDFGGGGKQVQDERLKDGRLTNVTPTISNFDKLDAADASVDVVTWFQGPHELWCTKDCGGPLGDPAESFAEISRVLKPGGYLVIMDHVAPQGTPTTSGDTMHRVDPMQIKALATGANFALEEESNILANPADDHTKGVFDPAIRGKTDQVLLRYKKP
jgi:predicted methyltransferase